MLVAVHKFTSHALLPSAMHIGLQPASTSRTSLLLFACLHFALITCARSPLIAISTCPPVFLILYAVCWRERFTSRRPKGHE